MAILSAGLLIFSATVTSCSNPLGPRVPPPGDEDDDDPTPDDQPGFAPYIVPVPPGR